jgi:hypothetical protein
MDISINKRIVILILIVILLLFAYYQIKCQHVDYFDVTIHDDTKQITKMVDLKHFFNFIEYFQISDLNPQEYQGSATDYRAAEFPRIEQDIIQLLRHLYRLTSKYNNLQDESPDTIRVHSYYTEQSMNINLLILKNLLDSLDRISQRDCLVILTSIKNSILSITNTSIYREYLHDQKFEPKYIGIVFNPGLMNIF